MNGDIPLCPSEEGPVALRSGQGKVQMLFTHQRLQALSPFQIYLLTNPLDPAPLEEAPEEL